VKYDDEHVPKSPKMVQVDPQCEAAKRVTIHGLRDRGLEVIVYNQCMGVGRVLEPEMYIAELNES